MIRYSGVRLRLSLTLPRTKCSRRALTTPSLHPDGAPEYVFSMDRRVFDWTHRKTWAWDATSSPTGTGVREEA